MNEPVDEKTQKELNIPLTYTNGLSANLKEFLHLIIKLIDEKKINLYSPISLINSAVYERLTPLQQGKVDFEALNLLSTIRDIDYLYRAGFENSYQMENVIDRLHNTKTRLEDEGGDLFII